MPLPWKALPGNNSGSLGKIPERETRITYVTPVASESFSLDKLLFDEFYIIKWSMRILALYKLLDEEKSFSLALETISWRKFTISRILVITQ